MTMIEDDAPSNASEQQPARSPTQQCTAVNDQVQCVLAAGHEGRERHIGHNPELRISRIWDTKPSDTDT